MQGLLLVGLGGCIGSIARYLLGHWIVQASAVQKFPLGTFIVNLTGCLVIGILAGFSEKHGVISPNARLFLFTGLLGGFTTFSAFGLETMTLLRRDELLVAALYVTGSVMLGLLAVWLGMKGVSLLPGKQ